MVLAIFNVVACTIMIAIVLTDLIKRKKVVRNSLWLSTMVVCAVCAILNLAGVEINTVLLITLASVATVSLIVLLALFIKDFVKGVKKFKQEMTQIPADVADEYQTDNTLATDNSQSYDMVANNDNHTQTIEQ